MACCLVALRYCSGALLHLDQPHPNLLPRSTAASIFPLRSASYAPELNAEEVKAGMQMLDTNQDGSIQLGARLAGGVAHGERCAASIRMGVRGVGAGAALTN